MNKLNETRNNKFIEEFKKTNFYQDYLNGKNKLESKDIICEVNSRKKICLTYARIKPKISYYICYNENYLYPITKIVFDNMFMDLKINDGRLTELKPKSSELEFYESMKNKYKNFNDLPNFFNSYKPKIKQLELYINNKMDELVADIKKNGYKYLLRYE